MPRNEEGGGRHGGIRGDRARTHRRAAVRRARATRHCLRLGLRRLSRAPSPRSRDTRRCSGRADRACARERPTRFSRNACAEAGIAHPEIRVLRAGGAVALAGQAARRFRRPAYRARADGSRASRPGEYWQRRVEGRAISLLFVRDSLALTPIAWSEQWTAPSAATPFRYGGAAGPVEVAAPQGLLAKLAALALLAWACAASRAPISSTTASASGCWKSIRGPGATLDVFDDDEDPAADASHRRAVRRRRPAAETPQPQSRGDRLRRGRRHSAAVAIGPTGPPTARRRGRLFLRARPILHGVCGGSDGGGGESEDRRAIRAHPNLASGGTPMSSASPIKVNEGASKWVDWLRAEAARLEVEVYTGSLGETLIDAGAKRRGGIEAGTRHRQNLPRRPGRSDADARRDAFARWPWTLIACARRSRSSRVSAANTRAGVLRMARDATRSSRWARGPRARWRKRSRCSRSLAIATRRRGRRW